MSRPMRINFCASNATVNPSAGTAVIVFGHVPQLGKAFQPLKHQLDLPTHAVRLQYFRCRTGGACREHEHVLSKFEGSWPSTHLLPTRLAVHASMSLLNRVVALSYCAQPTRKRGVLTMQDNPPLTVLPTLAKVRNRGSREIRLPCGVYATKL